MKDLLTTIAAGGLIAAIIIVIILVVPIIALWAINSLAEAGGSSFYIPHTLWNYLVAFVAIALVRGG